MKTERLFGIPLLLQSRKRLRAKELAKIFEVSIRTIYWDINSLSLVKERNPLLIRQNELLRRKEIGRECRVKEKEACKE